MLWAELKADGTLLIRASEPMECFALRQWEVAHKRGKAPLVIETGDPINIEKLARMVHKDLAAFRAWQSENTDAFVPAQDPSHAR